MKVWSRCDRCDFKVYAHQLKRESTGLAVCCDCYDGRFDIKRHPLNRPARARLEGRTVPDGRPMDIVLPTLLAEEQSATLLTEDGIPLEVTWPVWSPTMSGAGS